MEHDMDSAVKLPNSSASSETTHMANDTDRPPLPKRANRRRRAKRPFRVRVFEWVLVIVLALAVSALVRAFLMQAFWIPTSSMEDTLQIKDNVLVSRLTPRAIDIQRGDVVVFHDTQGWLPPPTPKQGFDKTLDSALTFVGLRSASGDQHLVKRVIGLGGDHVKCCTPDGELEVNGVAIKEPYLAPQSNNSLLEFDVTVPANKLWVMGDNRNYSADSRAHMDEPGQGFVAEEDVVGKVFWISFPIKHWGNPTSNEPFANVE